MDLNSILVSEFAKITNDNNETVNEGATVYGTYRVDGDGAYVQIDGSDTRTPVATTASANNGDRVTVLIKNHRAIVTGNLTDPSASSETVKTLDLGLGGLNDTIKNLSNSVSDLSGEVDGFSTQVTGMAASIEGAKKVATNFLSFEDPYGLIVGDLTGSTLGFNVLIDATSVNMRNNSTILAKYASDTIYLGYSNRKATINLCNGLGTITAGKNADADLWNDMIIGSIGGMYINADSILNLNTKYQSLEMGGKGINLISNRGGNYVGFEINHDLNTVSVYGIVDAVHGIKCRGNLTVNGVADIPGYSKTGHTHSQYYKSGSDINVREIKSLYTYNDKVDYSTNMYIGNTGLLHRTTKTSSREVKHDIKPIENADILPEKLYDVDIIQFIYNEGQLSHSSKRYGKELPGFIVEDLVEKYPIAVDIDEEGKPFQWNEQYLIPPMLALIQQQKKKLDELESRIEALEKKEV